jgi:UDP:flavonoid glycosyltransferase YjiC (YdhE family)
MHILFCTRPAYGHVYPLLPLAFTARRAGHDVRFTTTGAFVRTLAALGFPTYDVGLSIDAALAEVVDSAAGEAPKDPDGRPDREFGARLFIDVLAAATAADLTPLLRDVAPDIVVYEQFDIGAGVAAHAARLHAVCHALSPRTSLMGFGDVADERVERLWSRYSPGTSFDVFTGDRYLDIIPDALQADAFVGEPARLTMRPVPYSEPTARVPAWVHHSRRQVIYLTLGTVVATDDVLRPAISGLATLDAEVLVALGSADGHTLGAVPGNVHVESFVDQPGVLAAVDLVVHHGGTGTLLAAFAEGVPQLLLPKGADQFENADLVAARSLGDVLEPVNATPEAIVEVARAALGALRPAADRVRQQILAMPGPAAALDELVALHA